MKKEFIDSFTMEDSHNLPIETIKEYALDSAKRHEEYNLDPGYYYNDLEVEVAGPFTKVYYDVKIFGVPVCTHPQEKVKLKTDIFPHNVEVYYQCECGVKMKPKEFEEDK